MSKPVFYYPVTVVQDGSSYSATAPLIPALPIDSDQRVAILAEDAGFLSQGVYVTDDAGRWHFALPYEKMSAAAVFASTLTFYINPTVDAVAPAGSEVYRNGILQAGLDITSNPHRIYAVVTPLSTSGGGGGSVTLSGDVIGTGTGTIPTQLAASGVVAGVYTKVTVDAKGRVTFGAQLSGADVDTALGYTPYNGVTNPSGFLTGNQTITVSGDATGSGTTAITLALANTGVAAGTYTKVTVDAKGRVTLGANPTTLAGYGITDAVNKAGDTMTGTLTLSGGGTVTGVPNPVAPLDVVNKQSLDAAITGVATGVSWKSAMQVATTANIALTGTPIIDGYQTVAGDRVLAKDQTDAKQNGPYVVAAGAWTRTTDADIGSEIKGMAALVINGTTNALTQWVNTNGSVPVIGTDSITYGMLHGASQAYDAGTGLTLTGTTFSITNTGVAAGTYTKVTVNAQGQVTTGASLTATDVNTALGYTAYNGATNPNGFLTTNQNITVTGDVSGSGTTGLNLVLSATGVGAGTYNSVTVDAKGRVTAGTNPTTLAGYGITDAASTGQVAARAGASTSIFSGGALSINTDTTKFDVSAGNALFMDYTDPQNPVATILPFGPFAAQTLPNIGTQEVTYVGLTSAGTLVQQAGPFTATQRRTIAAIGLVIHSNHTSITTVNQTTTLNRSTLNQLQDLFEAIGPLNVSGNVYSANGANLSLNKTAGTLMRFGSNAATSVLDPHQVALVSQTALTFRYRTQLGNEGLNVTAIDPTKYDNAGVLTNVGNANFSIQRIYVFQSGLTRVQYGQATYNSLANALNAINTENFIVESNIFNNAVARALLIVKGDTTDLTDATRVRFIDVPKFGLANGGSSGATVTSADIIAALGYTPVSKSGDTMAGVLDWASTVTIASAATVDLGTAGSNSVLVTGNVTITALGTDTAGAARWVTFTGTPVLTHNATSLILPTGANITAAAGDSAIFMSLGAGNWRCINYQRADGTSLVGAPDPTKLPLAGGTLSGTLNLAPAVTQGAGASMNVAGAAANDVTVTGSASIAALGTIAAGAHRTITFVNTGTLVYNATSLILPSAANISYAAGDTAEFVSLGGGNWKCLWYARADGTALIASSSSDPTKLPLAGGTMTGALNLATPVTLASSATTAIGAAASNNLTITGGVNITAFDTIASGASRTLTFSAALTLTHNAVSLILPTGTNILTAAGDTAEFVSLGAGNWKCRFYQRADGTPVAGTSTTDPTKLPLAGGTMTGAINEAVPVSLASAATVNIGAAAANSVAVTGTTTITAFDTIAAGAVRTLTFSGILTLTNNGTSLILPGAANITTAAGDVAEFLSLGAGNWKCRYYARADGTALVGGSGFTGGTLTSALNYAPTTTLTAAATVNIGAAATNSITISGTTGINAFDTIAAGATRYVVFSSTGGTLGNNASIILPTAAGSINVFAGDSAEFISQGAGVWKCLWFQRKDGTPLTTPNDTTKVAKAGDTMTGALNYATIATIASALTTDLTNASSNNILITGTSTITSFGTGVIGAHRSIRFQSAGLLLGTGIGRLPTGANITTQANDYAEFICVAAGSWDCLLYTRADGTSLAGGSGFTGGTLTSALNEAPPVSLASAATVNIGAAASNNVTITGTTTISAFDTIAAGAHRTLTFSAALVLTNSANLALPSGASITTAAGDVADFVSLGAGAWKCVFYTKANGQAVINFAGGTLTTAINNATPVTLASAATVNIGAAAGNDITVTGSITITAFDVIASGAHRTLTFQNTPVLTHNATSLILPTAANITAIAGDTAEFVSLGGGNWKCLWYMRSNGQALVPASTFTTAVNFAPTVTVGAGASMNIGAQAANDITVTGTATVSALGTIAAGAHRTLTFSNAGGTLVHNATSLILPGSANIAWAAGDLAQFVSLGGGNWKCEFYTKADGTSVGPATFSGGTLSNALNYAPIVAQGAVNPQPVAGAASNVIQLVSTNTLTGFNSGTSGMTRKILFNATTTLTHNATSFILPGAANIVAVAGDSAEFVCLGTTNWQCISFQTASGQDVVPKMRLSGDKMTGVLNLATPVSVASAATTDIVNVAANDVTVTGTTTITAFVGTSSGSHRTLTFSGSLTLTHNGTSLILPGGQNIVTQAGDVAEFVSLGPSNWRCEFYTRADGRAVLGSQFTTEQVVSTTQTLTAAVNGRLLVGGSASAFTLTLPLASAVPAGQTITFFNSGAGIMTVSRQGTDTIDGVAGNTSVTLGQSDNLILESIGSGGWRAIGGSAQLGFTAAFGKLLSGTGYQKLPGGLIMQWGTTTASASADVAVTFPTTFPTAVGTLQITSAGGVGTFANYNTLSTTGFNLAAWTDTATRNGAICTWLAFGY